MISKQLCCICYNVVVKYNISEDIRIVYKILDISFSKLADELNIARSMVLRIVKKRSLPNGSFFRTPNGNPRLFNCRDENEPWLLFTICGKNML